MNSGAFGVFSAELSAPILFHYSTIISTEKLSLYILIPNIYLGLGFEFGPQRICDLAFRVRSPRQYSSAHWVTKVKLLIKFDSITEGHRISDFYM